MNLHEKITQHLDHAGDGQTFFDLKDGLNFPFLKSGVLMAELKKLQEQDKVELGVDDRWYLTGKRKTPGPKLNSAVVDALVAEFTNPLAAVALTAEPAIPPEKLDRTSHGVKLKAWLLEQQASGLGPHTMTEIARLCPLGTERRVRAVERAIWSIANVGDERDLQLLNAMIWNLPAEYAGKPSPDPIAAPTVAVSPTPTAYNPVSDMQREVNELWTMLTEMRHPPQSAVWSALCNGLDDVLRDIGVPENMIRVNLQEMADHFSRRELPALDRKPSKPESFFVNIAADFVQHNPDKLVDTLTDAYRIGYQTGLWDIMDMIKKNACYAEDES